MSYPTRLLAWRYMRSKRREGFVSIITLFSVLGIMLGVATLILVTSLMNGIRDEMISNFIGIDGHITIYGRGEPLVGTDLLIDELQQISGVTKATARVQGQVMVSAERRSLGARVIGLKEKDLFANAKLSSSLTYGKTDSFPRGGGIFIGKRLADNMGVLVGDSLSLISPQGRHTFAGFVPRIKSFTVRGTFELGMHMLDASLILMPYSDAAIYFALPKKDGGVASSLSLELSDRNTAQKLVETIHNQLGSEYRIYDYQTSNQGIFTALNVQRDVMIVILALIIVVAAFNIISSLIMLVQDKARDVAILRTMGASRSMILHIFMLSGMAIGVVGTLLGLLLGLLAAANIEVLRKGLESLMGQELLVGDIYFLSSLPTKTEPNEVIGVVLLSLGLSFFSTIYPAWRASAQEPAEALRYE